MYSEVFAGCCFYLLELFFFRVYYALSPFYLDEI